MSHRPLELLPDEELCDEVERRYRRVQQAQAEYLESLAVLDTRPSAVPGARAGTVARTFARHRLRNSRATADVRAAHALAGDLPMLGKALAAGDVAREHVDVAVRALRQIPHHLRSDAAAVAKVDGWFTETALALPPLQTDHAAKALLTYLDPDGSRSFDPAAVDRRELSVAVDATGMVILRGQLDPAAGAVVRAALDHYSAPDPTDPQTGVADLRSKRQRQADALGTIAGLSLNAEPDTADSTADNGEAGMRGPRRVPVRPRLVIHLPAGDSDEVGPLAPPWLARFACDSVVQAVRPEKLMLGRSVRTATEAQRRFLAARDGGCVIPGCHAPPAWTEAHHVDWWSTGGATDVTNMALVCGRHHTEIHARIWALRIIDGIPWAIPPRWLDARQRPIRNTYRDHRTAAEQLAIDLQPP